MSEAIVADPATLAAAAVRAIADAPLLPAKLSLCGALVVCLVLAMAEIG